MNKLKKSLTIGAVIFVAVIFASCAGTNITPRITPDNCVAIGNDAFAVGECPNGDRFVEYNQTQLDGSKVRARATWQHGSNNYKLNYYVGEVLFEYTPSAKNPLYIGKPPLSRQEAEARAEQENTTQLE